jgi:hypothetical protein
MAIIQAIVEGETNPQKLSSLKDRRIKSSTAEIAKALTGDYREEHLFVLRQELTLYQMGAALFPIREVKQLIKFLDSQIYKHDYD